MSIGNLKTETNKKINYIKAAIEDYKECLKGDLTKDCRHYLQDELTKAKRNLKYFEEILEVLESDDLSDYQY